MWGVILFMNINYLISFIETVKQKSISKACKNLHLTQSALSQQLQTLEKSLNTKLLIRSNKGIVLTQEGEIVLGYAETLINLYNNMNKDIVDSRKSVIQGIKISSCGSVGEYLIPCTLHVYKKDHENVRFLLKNKHTKYVIEDIIDCSADIGFIDKEIFVEGIDCFKICNNTLTFIYPPSNKELEGKQLTLSDISKLPLIMGPKGSGLREIIENIFYINNISPDDLNIEMELDSIESIKTSIAKGLGVAIVPYISVKKEIYTNIIKSTCIEEMHPTCSICLIYKKNKVTNSYVKEFITFIKKYGSATFC